MIPMYGATLALAGYWAIQQADVDRGRASAEGVCVGCERHPADATQCDMCQRDVRQLMNVWLSTQRALAKREIGRKLRGKALDRYLDDCIKDARLTFPRVALP
jgi:hypothetical protein